MSYSGYKNNAGSVKRLTKIWAYDILIQKSHHFIEGSWVGQAWLTLGKFMLSPSPFFSPTCPEICSTIPDRMIFPGAEVKMSEPAVPWIILLASLKMGATFAFFQSLGTSTLQGCWPALWAPSDAACRVSRTCRGLALLSNP